MAEVPLAPIEAFVRDESPQRIVFGWGRRREVPEEVDRLSARRVLLVSERSTRRVAGEILKQLGSKVVATIPEVRPHVPRDSVGAAVTTAASSGADLLVTVGGGSATGLGKAVILEHAAPLMALPTTYAGSEVTPIYGITQSGRKLTGRDDRVLPRTVLYDPQLTTTLPKRTTASSGLNALAHCIEALYAADAPSTTRALSGEAIRMLHRSLPVCVADPMDEGGRSCALYGAYQAGTVLATAGMAIHHRICHVLGGTFGLPHGDVNAVVLPHAVAFNEPATSDALTGVANLLGTHTAAAGLYDFGAALGAPVSLRELGMDRAVLERAASIVGEGDFGNPRTAGPSEVLAILEAAFEGKRPAEVTRSGRNG